MIDGEERTAIKLIVEPQKFKQPVCSMQTGCFYNGGMKMKIFDAHCDVLLQLWSAQGKRILKMIHNYILHLNS